MFNRFESLSLITSTTICVQYVFLSNFHAIVSSSSCLTVKLSNHNRTIKCNNHLVASSPTNIPAHNDQYPTNDDHIFLDTRSEVGLSQSHPNQHLPYFTPVHATLPWPVLRLPCIPTFQHHNPPIYLSHCFQLLNPLHQQATVIIQITHYLVPPLPSIPEYLHHVYPTYLQST